MAITYAAPTITITGGAWAGTVVGSNSLNISDTGQTWAANALVGRVLIITSGTGIGQRRQITSNSATLIIVGQAFTITPPVGSTFIISYNFSDIKVANDAGTWGVVSLQGTNQYRLTAAIVVGDNTNYSALCEVNTSFEITTHQTALKIYLYGSAIYVRSLGICRLGAISSESSRITEQGCDYFASSTTTMTEAISGDYSAVIEICSSKIRRAVYGYIWHKGTSATGVFRLWNSMINCDVLSDGAGQISDISGLTISQELLANTIGIRVNGGYTNDIKVYRSQLASAGVALAGTACIIRGLYTRGSNNLFRGGGMNVMDSKLIDCDTDTWTISNLNTLDTQKLLRQWSVNYTTPSQSSVQIAIFNNVGTQVVNTATNGSGVLAEQIISEGYYTYATGQTMQGYNNHKLVIRKYGLIFLNMVMAYTAKTVAAWNLTTNPFVVASSATATAYTGIAINGSAETITLSSAHTLQELYDYTQAWADDSGNMQYDEPITTTDGITFSTANGWTLIGIENLTFNSQRLNGGTISVSTAGTYSPRLQTNVFTMSATGTYNLTGADISGTITLINTSGGAVTVRLIPGVSYVNGGTSITVENTVNVYITAPNILTGSRIRLYNVTKSTDIDNSVVTSPYSFEVTLGGGIDAGDIIQMTATCYLGTTAKREITSFGQMSSAGLSFIDIQTDWTEVNNWNIDASTITEFYAGYADIYVNADDLDGTSAKTRFAAWYVYNNTTADGIKYYIGGLEIPASNVIRVNTDILDLKIFNVSATPLEFSEVDVRLYRKDGTTILATGSNSINNDYNGVPDYTIITVSGASVITGDISQIAPLVTSDLDNNSKQLKTIVGLSAAAASK